MNFSQPADRSRVILIDWGRATKRACRRWRTTSELTEKAPNSRGPVIAVYACVKNARRVAHAGPVLTIL